MNTISNQAAHASLVAMQAALLAQIASQRGGVMSRAEAAAEHFAHREDSSAQVATEKELEFAVGERETDKLNQIAQALARIEAGSYGQCIGCGEEIAPQRLQATPDALRCLACQTGFETSHRQ